MVTTTIPVAGVVKVLVAMAIIAQSVCPTAFALSNTGFCLAPERPYLPHTSRRADPTLGRSRVVSVNGNHPRRRISKC